MRTNQTINLLKYIFSIGIIAIHMQLFMGNIVPYALFTMGITRLGVPFFFIVTGYFLFKKTAGKQSLVPFFKRNLILYLIPVTLELFFSWRYFWRFEPLSEIAYPIWQSISAGMGGMFWYFPALFLGLILLIPFWKKGIVWPGLVIGLVLYLLALNADSYFARLNYPWLLEYASIHSWLWRWPQAGVSSSLLYLSMGAFLQKQKAAEKLNVSGWLVLGSIAVLLTEALIQQSKGVPDGNCYFALLAAVPLVFLYALQHPHTKWKWAGILGKMSIYVYLVHPLFINMSRIMLGGRMDLLCFGLAAILSSICAWLICQIIRMVSRYKSRAALSKKFTASA